MEADEAAGNRFLVNQRSLSPYTGVMKGVWWASLVGLASVAVFGNLAATTQDKPQQEFIAPGFDAGEVAWVKRTHAELVKSLDDIDLTKGISKEVLPDGTVVEKRGGAFVRVRSSLHCAPIIRGAVSKATY